MVSPASLVAALPPCLALSVVYPGHAPAVARDVGPLVERALAAQAPPLAVAALGPHRVRAAPLAQRDLPLGREAAVALPRVPHRGRGDAEHRGDLPRRPLGGGLHPAHHVLGPEDVSPPRRAPVLFSGKMCRFCRWAKRPISAVADSAQAHPRTHRGADP